VTFSLLTKAKRRPESFQVVGKHPGSVIRFARAKASPKQTLVAHAGSDGPAKSGRFRRQANPPKRRIGDRAAERFVEDCGIQVLRKHSPAVRWPAFEGVELGRFETSRVYRFDKHQCFRLCAQESLQDIGA
jgi:hypothetical protein